MISLKKRIISAAAAGVMALNVVTPALATEIVISGNGSGSDNQVNVQTTNATTVSQNNEAKVTNTVKTNADTGDNKANYNTGGNVGIQTGDAKVSVDVANTLNSNQAKVDCCAASGADVKISGNGANSDNTVNLLNTNTTSVTQNNQADVKNKIDADAETGNNKSGLNTGGDVVIKTGSAKVDVNVSTTANVNSVKVGSGHSATPTPSASFEIVGNGANSDNLIAAALNNTTTVNQNNTAKVKNDVDVDADTGDNKANFNTGGDVVIWTGNAKVDVDVDNMVNFNAADLNCGCEFDVLAKIAGNGGSDKKHHFWWWFNKPDNSIQLNLENTQALGQVNLANLNNYVDVDDAETGDNEASSNTGTPDSDPAILTGNAASDVSVSNSGNMNVLGNLPFSLPQMPNVNFSFNMAFLWAMFGFSL